MRECGEKSFKDKEPPLQRNPRVSTSPPDTKPLLQTVPDLAIRDEGLGHSLAPGFPRAPRSSLPVLSCDSDHMRLLIHKKLL
jgi:hypothetical protein